MTTASEVCERALLIIGALDQSETMEGPQAARALAEYNQMIRGLVGNGLGGQLVSIPASSATTVQSGYIYACDTLNAAFTLTLPSSPKEGMVFGVADAQSKFATNNLTLDPVTSLLEGSRADLVLSVNDDNRIWYFRADTANWEKVRDLTINQNVPFPDAAIDPLVYMLAGRLAVAYNVPVNETLAAQTVVARQSFVRRFGRRGRNQNDPAIGVVTASAVQRANNP